jgi:hypothetical protein
MVMSSRSVVNLQVETDVIQTEMEIFQMVCQRDWSVATLLHGYGRSGHFVRLRTGFSRDRWCNEMGGNRG